MILYSKGSQLKFFVVKNNKMKFDDHASDSSSVNSDSDKSDSENKSEESDIDNNKVSRKGSFQARESRKRKNKEESPVRVKGGMSLLFSTMHSNLQPGIILKHRWSSQVWSGIHF